MKPERAERERDRIDRAARARILAAIERLAADPSAADIRKLAGRANEWRLRVGGYRVRFALDDQAGAIVVLHMRPRASAYRE